MWTARASTLFSYTLTGLQPPFYTIHFRYTAVPGRAAFPQIPVSLSTETAAFAQISETGDAQYPVGMRACVCVDLSEVCPFYRSCQAYGYASFIGFMVYVFFACFFLKVFSEFVLFPTAGCSRRVLMRATGIWVFGFGWSGFEGCEVLSRAVVYEER